MARLLVKIEDVISVLRKSKNPRGVVDAMQSIIVVRFGSQHQVDKCWRIIADPPERQENPLITR